MVSSSVHLLIIILLVSILLGIAVVLSLRGGRINEGYDDIISKKSTLYNSTGNMRLFYSDGTTTDNKAVFFNPSSNDIVCTNDNLNSLCDPNKSSLEYVTTLDSRTKFSDTHVDCSGHMSPEVFSAPDHADCQLRILTGNYEFSKTCIMLDISVDNISEDNIYLDPKSYSTKLFLLLRPVFVRGPMCTPIMMYAPNEAGWLPSDNLIKLQVHKVTDVGISGRGNGSVQKLSDVIRTYAATAKKQKQKFVRIPVVLYYLNFVNDLPINTQTSNVCTLYISSSMTETTTTALNSQVSVGVNSKAVIIATPVGQYPFPRINGLMVITFSTSLLLVTLFQTDGRLLMARFDGQPMFSIDRGTLDDHVIPKFSPPGDILSPYTCTCIPNLADIGVRLHLIHNGKGVSGILNHELGGWGKKAKPVKKPLNSGVIHPGHAKHMCLDVWGESKETGAKVTIWECHGGDNQQWKLNNKRSLVNVNSGKCLNVWGASTKAGTEVKQYPCDGGANSTWKQVDGTLRPDHAPNMCLEANDVAGKLVLNNCTGGANQRFEISTFAPPPAPAPAPPPPPPPPPPSGGLPSGTFQLKNVTKNNMCLDDGGVTTSGGGDFHTWTCDPTNTNQTWTYDPTTKLIKNPNKYNLCLDDGGGTTNGQTNFHLWTCDPNNKNQQWVFDPTTKLLKNPNKNMCLDDGGGTTDGQTNFHIWECGPTNVNQQYAPVPLPAPPPPPPPKAKQCPRPDGWCRHPTAIFKRLNCADTTGGGSIGPQNDMTCIDASDQHGTILSSQNCASVWPAAPVMSCPATNAWTKTDNMDGSYSNTYFTSDPSKKFEVGIINVDNGTISNDGGRTYVAAQIAGETINVPTWNVSGKFTQTQGVKQINWNNASVWDSTIPAPAPEFKIIQHKQTGKCLDGDGEKLYFNPCQKGNGYQNWKHVQGVDADNFLFQHKQTGKCLDANGTALYFGPCQKYNAYQNFSEVPGLPGNIQIKHKQSGKCVDGNGSSLYFGPCQKDNGYQNWSEI